VGVDDQAVPVGVEGGSYGLVQAGMVRVVEAQEQHFAFRFCQRASERTAVSGFGIDRAHAHGRHALVSVISEAFRIDHEAAHGEAQLCCERPRHREQPVRQMVRHQGEFAIEFLIVQYELITYVVWDFR
jgi:hypothetical protein